MSDAQFHHTHRVSYAECTIGNHVYYARYLDILEEARGEFFRELGRTCLEWQEKGIIFPVIECHIKYKAPARYDDVLTVDVRPAKTEGVRLNFAYRITNQHGQLILEAETCHVCASLDEKPKRVPADLIRKMAGCP